MTEISDGMIRRMRNLKMYQGKSDEEIRAMMEEKSLKDSMMPPKGKVDKSYEAKFKEKLEILQDEFSLDMNNANDRESLSALVRHMLQSEATDEAIRTIYDKGNHDAEDIRNLKNLGDMQRSISQTISDLQDKLGISRKVRKEKQTDDIPQWIDGVLDRAKNMFDRSTTKVECPKCRIELFRFWINFPQMENKVSAQLTCWKCKEAVIYNK